MSDESAVVRGMRVCSSLPLVGEWEKIVDERGWQLLEDRAVAKMLAMGFGRRRGESEARDESVVVGQVGDPSTLDGVRFGWWDEGTTQQVDWEWQYCVMRKGPQVPSTRSRTNAD
jgi:hypothetical protein